MTYRLFAHKDCTEFLHVAQPFLAADPCLRGSVWGDALRALDIEDARAWTLQRLADNAVVGALVWTAPKRALFTTDLPIDAGPAIVKGLRNFTTESAKPQLLGILGPQACINLLREAWQQAHLDPPLVKLSMRLYRCDRVTRSFEVPGSLRLAVEDDRPLCNEWARLFGIDAGITAPNHPAPSIDQHLDQRRLFLWESNGAPIASAAWGRPTPHSAHVSFVFVPEEHRGQHFAGAVTSAITRHLLEHEGKTFVTLFTDAANPITNHLYPSLGYGLVDFFQEAEFPS